MVVKDGQNPDAGNLGADPRNQIESDALLNYQRLLSWAKTHTRIAHNLLRPESLANEQQLRKLFSSSLEMGQEIINSCSASAPSHQPLPNVPDIKEISAHLALARIGSAPPISARKDCGLPLSGSFRFGSDPVMGSALGTALGRPLVFSEDLAKKTHPLAPSRSYSKKKAF
jgi:hypothetical protein